MTTNKWDLYFLGLCLHIASMSKDPSTKVGSVIVGPDREIRSTGFNGFPRGIEDSDERLSNREVKLSLVVHAELNAILAAARVGVPIKDCKLYLTATDSSGLIWGGAPCTRCTVELIQAGISEVISWPYKDVPSNWTDDITVAQSLLFEAGVIYREVDNVQV